MTISSSENRPTYVGLSLGVSDLLHSSATIQGGALAIIEAGRVEELRAAVPRMRDQARKPSGPEGVDDAIRPWFATYPQPERDDDDWVAFWGGYVIVVGHMSTASLRGAMATWAKRPDAQFLPKPGQLLELAQNTPTPAARLAGHAWQVLNQCDDMLQIQRTKAAMEADGVKPEEQRVAVAAMLHDFQAKSVPAVERAQRVLNRGAAGAERPDADLPSLAGATAPGSALTPQMLRLLGRPIPGAAPPVEEAPPPDDAMAEPWEIELWEAEEAAR